MARSRGSSLARRINALLFGALALMAVSQWITVSFFISDALREYAAASGGDIADLLALQSLPQLRRMDYSAIRASAESLMRNRDVLSVTIRDAEGFDLTPFSSRDMQAGTRSIEIRRDVVDEVERRLGSVELHFSLAAADRGAAKVGLLLIVGFIAVSAAAIAAISLMMRNLVVKPIKVIVSMMEGVARGELGLQVPAERSDEIGALADNFNEMSKALKRSLENQLRAEKMASLGGLVAGVAHEINTPLGVAITAVSHLSDITRSLGTALATGELTREELDAFVADSYQTSEVTQTNLLHAAGLVRSFKQISVDQASGEERSFDVANYLREILSSLAPEMKKAGIDVSLDAPDGVRLVSCPGPLFQIVTILVMNARIHAFGERRDGKVKVAASVRADMLELTVSDDGRGMSPEERAKAFDPFYTTRRGSGGTGLGLYILYNIVTESFHGTVDAFSEPGRGSRFVVRLPIGTAALRLAP
jgi:signal transduction histidine kinase